MNNLVKNILTKLTPEWKVFAHATGLSVHIIGYIDLENINDQSKLELFLEELIKRNPSNFMILIEKSLADIGKLEILNEIKLLQASDLLKSYYTRSYGDTNILNRCCSDKQKVDQVNTDVDLDISNLDLICINADDVSAYADSKKLDEWEYFVKKLHDQSNKTMTFEKVSLEQPQLLLLSGIAGIGKTYFLQKCAFCWAMGLIWKNLDFVFYFEFKKLSKFSCVSNPQEIVNKFYKNILKKQDIMSSTKSVMFLIDGLDEFIHFEQLYNCMSGDYSNLPLISTLRHVLNTRNIRCVLGGRVEAVMKYHSLVKKCEDILHIQIKGFSNIGRRNYFKSSLMSKTLRNTIEKFITSSPVGEALMSVPFYTKVLCSALSLCFDGFSLKTTTELLTLIFLQFVQKINETDEPLYQLMQKNKQHIFNVCNVAFIMLQEGRVTVSETELAIVLDNNSFEPFGFIVKSSLSHQYHFVHLFLMNFCASVYMFFYKNPEEVFKQERLRSCLPAVCGLLYGDGKNFLSLISQLQEPLNKGKSWLKEICDSSDSSDSSDRDQKIFMKMFMECFFEAQALITEDFKKSISKRDWSIVMDDRKTAQEFLHEKYFMEKFFDAGIKLNWLMVYKNILSEDEKNLLIKCSTNVRYVWFTRPLKIDGWNPKHRIEHLWIDISRTFVSKNEFESFLVWIRLAERLTLDLQDDTNFIDDICEWLCGFKFEKLLINIRGKIFNNIEELKKLK